MNTRTNELPDLNNGYGLTDQQIKDFQAKGHTCLQGVLSHKEVEAYEPFIIKAANRYNEEKRKLEERDTYGKAFLQIMNLWKHDQAVRRFVLAERFAKIAADLMGVENVRLYHDQALFKEPGGGATPWHI